MIIDRFAEYARFEASRPLPAEAAHHARRALIDWFAALFPGIGVAPGVQLMAAHAASGVTGALDILEGAAGFGAAMSVEPKWERATDALGEHYNICAITQKNHGCCGHTFAAIDAMLEIRAKLLETGGIEADAVERIRVDTYKTALDVTGNFEPTTAFKAKFSLPYVVAHGLLHGAVRLNAFEAQRLAQAQLRVLMARTELNADSELSAGFPNVRAARVAVTLKDGRVLEHFAPCREGDPEAPLADVDIDDKFLELASPVIGAEKARDLLAKLWSIDSRSVADLALTRL